ncbi:hypothetical protein CERZMDRAFT_66191 [Cercospora zeae-maydis SCOH1-5]|uniref:UEV domain-containing protein n=1 Tax=Cercospora zeae-maydis SCOH1-5 TaxID=717836 RepID=A0A6A6FNG9_9PEZI|nr:hypothetical protein CERZMDRAFT_66191 [Cercospora zeae-maydis SCOH1-5]
MAALPDKVLAWLYSVLHDYHDPQRTYSDTVRALAQYPTLAPRTEVYTHENGTSALLLTVSGTLPVAFRGTTYHFPVKVWVPHAYPYEAPNVFVTPGKDMLVRPGQHVAVDGRVYHPYLRDWGRMWETASISELAECLQQIFGREPPVVSRAQQEQQQPRPIPQAHPGAPPPPPKQPVGTAGPSRSADPNAPPPLPPKPGAAPVPGEEYAETARDVSRDGPPLPPLPGEMPRNQRISSLSSNSYRPTSINPAPPYGAPSPGHHNGQVPGPSFQHPQHAHYQQYPRAQDLSPVSPMSPPRGAQELPTSRHAQPAPLPAPQFQPQRPAHQTHQNPAPQHHPQHLPQYGPPAHAQQRPYAQQQPSPYQHPPSQPPQPKRAAPDLLTDPFDVAMPGPEVQQNMPAPPIPPNPEKEHLLQALSSTLVQQAQQKVNQNLSAIAPLEAQQQAIYAAQQRLDGEIRQLEQLEKALTNNESILHRSIQDCDRTIATARSKKQPPIDDVLIAPTMVANQLWTLCAEEAACREAMYVLQKANDRGRVSGDVFIRQMRGLGRECFLKMALARKCATGMGLERTR